ncbi:ABC-2 type transport system ATP-binding protein [Catalinimonas alkaloidigena]|uniref:ABC-2 type transport system ATP-binding protein n=1 Tax=Catalinimonas alkaloidigena TaxID=1075417 RepID=A0A1G8X3P4_9BACT|nr:ABC transporter ATP-binding protein [Catalinimonas alkaloidigena]SDJ84475.1 ABC-2 type transport system ATP-binding protein [Catalinimonas alkaloidigena]
MIELHNLKKAYEAGKLVLDIPALSIATGESIGLIGNNGAGKTTLLSLILDLIAPTTGEVRSKGQLVVRSEHWKPYTGSYLHEGFLIGYLTPAEYFRFVGKLHGLNAADVRTFLESSAGFSDEVLFETRKLNRDLSKGNKTKVGVIAAMLGRPELLIFDEPFANLDPTSQAWLKRRLRQLHAEGTTLILSSHDLKHITEVSQRILLLERGRVVQDVPTTEETLPALEHYFAV